MKKLILSICCILCCGVCGAQSANRWGEIREAYLRDLQHLVTDYFYQYCQYPTTVDELVRHAERTSLFDPYIKEYGCMYWKELTMALKKEKEHLRIEMDAGLTYYTDSVDSPGYLIPEKRPYFYLFFDKDALLFCCTDDHPGPCELASDIGIYPNEYTLHCGRFERPRLYNSAGEVLFSSKKETERFRRGFQKLKESYLPKIKDSFGWTYPVHYYVYEGGMFGNGKGERASIRRFVEYREAELYDFCTNETITHESLFYEKLTEFLKHYAKKNKCVKIRFMMPYYSANGESVEVK